MAGYRLNRIFGENVMSYPELDLKLPKDFYLIRSAGEDGEGTNASQSNGFGKSAVLECVSVAAYQSTLRGTKKIARRQGPGWFRAGIELGDENGNALSIVRYKGHPKKKTKLEIFSGDVDLSQDLTDTKSQEIVDDRVGAHDSFVFRCVSPELSSFLGLQPAKRTEAMLAHVGMDFDRLQARASEAYSDQYGEVHLKENAHRGATDAVVRIGAKLAASQEYETKIEEQRERCFFRIKKLNDAAEAGSIEVLALRDAAVEAGKRIEAAREALEAVPDVAETVELSDEQKAKLKKYAEILTQAKAQLADFPEELEEPSEERIAAGCQWEKATEQLEEATIAVKEHPELPTTKTDEEQGLIDGLVLLRGSIDTLVGDEAILNSREASYRESLKTGTCPECERSYDAKALEKSLEEIVNARPALEAQRVELEAGVKIAQDMLDGHTQTREAARKKREGLETALRDAEKTVVEAKLNIERTDKEDQRAYNDQRAALERAVVDAERDHTNASAVAQQAAEHARQQKLQQCQHNLKEAEQILISTNKEADAAEAAVKEHLRTVREVEEEDLPALQSKEDEIKELGKEFEILESRAKEAESKATAAQLDLRVLGAWKEQLGSKGIRHQFLEDVLGALNARLKPYLEAMFLNRGVHLQFIVKNARVDYELEGIEYESASNGERKRLDVAVVLAISDLHAPGGHSIGFRFFDEIMDALDPDGVSAVMGLLSRIGDQVFLVSHNPVFEAELAMQLGDRLGIITVTKQGDKSRAEVTA